MILVDTSVLIDYLKGIKNKATERFEEILVKKIPFGINNFIYIELLQGSKTEKDFKTLKKYLDSQVFYDLKNGRESFAEAARMYLKLRQKGSSVSSSVDCLIARVAIENDIFLLHNDSDFDKVCNYFPLKIWEI
jgi:predicted nucleic acid-binding protein